MLEVVDFGAVDEGALEVWGAFVVDEDDVVDFTVVVEVSIPTVDEVSSIETSESTSVEVVEVDEPSADIGV